MNTHDRTGPDFTLEPFTHTMRRNPQCHLDSITQATEAAQFAKDGEADLSKVLDLVADLRRCRAGEPVHTPTMPAIQPNERGEVWLTDDGAAQQLADMAHSALARLLMSHESLQCLADPGERYRRLLDDALAGLERVLRAT